jgi:hypothetical protein
MNDDLIENSRGKYQNGQINRASNRRITGFHTSIICV